jgi:hypothetical protein
MPIWWSWDGTAWGICGFVLGEAVAGPSPQRRLFSRGARSAHECIVSIDLAGKSRPAHREIFQNLSFSFTLR